MIEINAIFLTIVNFIKKKSNIVFVVTSIFLWTILAFTYGDADYYLYLSRYNNLELWSGQTELLYSLSMSISYNLGLSFQGYRAIIATVEVILVCSTIKKLAKFPNLVLICYMIVPFLLNVTQQRNMLATSIFIWFSRYLFEKNENKTRIRISRNVTLDKSDMKYVLGIILATLVHTAAFIWIVLLVAKKCNTKKCIICVLVVNFLIIFLITPELLAKMIVLISKGAATRIISYTTDEYKNSEWRHYSQILYVIIVEFTIIFMYLFMLKKKKSFNVNKDTLIALNMNICILVVLSIMIRYTQEVYRMQEGLFVINYITITNSIKKENYSSNKMSVNSIIVKFMLIGIIVFSAWFLIYRYLIPSVVVPAMKNNYLWNSIIRR